MRKTIPLIMLMIALSVWIVGTEPVTGEEGAGEKGLPVKVVKARKVNFASTLQAMGTVQMMAKADVSSEIQGLLAEVKVEEGDLVEKGQVIARVDATLLKAELEKRKTYEELADIDVSSQTYELEKAESKVKATGIAMERARSYFEMQQNLFKMGAVTQSVRDQAEIDYQKSLAAHENAKGDLSLLQVRSGKGKKKAEILLEKARADVKEIRKKIEKCAIKAPIGGMVALKKKWKGEHVTQGDSVILTIIDIRDVYAEVDVSEKDLPVLKVGQPARVIADAYPGQPFKGRVERMSPTVDRTSRTVRVKVRVPNPRYLLKPGMFVRVDILYGSKSDQGAVPQSALVKGEDGHYFAFAVIEGIAFLREVVPGPAKKGWVIVKRGIRPGELVVVEGQKELRDLAPVQAEEVGTK